MKTRYFVMMFFIAALFITGCVKDEIFEGPPVITNMSMSPLAPGDNDVVTVTAKVTSNDGVKAVILFYKAGTGSFTSVAMTASGSTYSGQIPAQASDVQVQYYIEAESNAGKKMTNPAGAPASAASYTVGAPSILMNEIYSRGVPEDPDWIEIYNNSDSPADLTGYKIYDPGGQSGTKQKLEFPAGTVVPPKGFYVIVVDVGGEAGFGLSSGGDEVWLENASGSVIDNTSFPGFEPTQSWARVPDGSPNWQIVNTITRGTANSSEVPAPTLFINEVFSQGTTEDPDWVEIYNASAFDADISGYKIYDSGGQSGSKPKKAFPAGTTITAHGFVVIVTDDADASGFGLSSDGEEIWLENPSGNVIDNCVFPALKANESYGRYPDGASTFQAFYVVTKGAANDNTPPPQVRIVMNELYSQGTTEDPDWIEVYNDSDIDVDLSGYKIYDSGGQAGTKPKKEFPAGTTIQSKGFVVIVTDDEAESGFGLSSGGEQVWLENADGTVIDDVTFPALEAGQSYGRYPDGAENWQMLYTVTKGTANSDVIPDVVLIWMNELYSRGTTEDPDWIEIFNDSDKDIDLSGYKIYDSGGQSGSKPKKEFPAGTVIPTGGFFVIVTDDEAESGFGLSSGGEQVWLENADGTVIDSVTFPALEETQSYGRYPDGIDNWQILYTVTRGAANSNAVPGGVVMNELYSRGVTGDPDWVEIYNASPVELDISGYKIYDPGGQSGSKPKKEFPAGSIVPAMGWLVIVVDDDDPSGFGLSSGGDEVWLEDTSGTVIDYIAIPAMETTQSYGRLPDGSDTWQLLNTITRGTANMP
ncbi:MAG: lamin tail domain-containing protein [Bacteroidales bacterium]|nr:lamin tail domain-containing protein [Lentimicrobiaceae bacterium]MDD5696096.1 lamin tail domain-containing protein [Bacteroidales bacterium]